VHIIIIIVGIIVLFGPSCGTLFYVMLLV